MTNDLYLQCAKCRVCKGAAYQSIPLLGSGQFLETAPILGIAQNPGKIDGDKDERFIADHIFRKLDEKDVESGLIELYASWGFARSQMRRALNEIFGPDWYENGLFYWTNAVRCRTPKNARPDWDMVDACSLWTDRLLEGRKAVVFVGGVAREQTLPDANKSLPWGTLRFNKKMGLYMLAVRHPAAWGMTKGMSRADEVASYTKEVDRLIKLVKEAK